MPQDGTSLATCSRTLVFVGMGGSFFIIPKKSNQFNMQINLFQDPAVVRIQQRERRSSSSPMSKKIWLFSRSRGCVPDLSGLSSTWRNAITGAPGFGSESRIHTLGNLSDTVWRVGRWRFSFNYLATAVTPLLIVSHL